MFGAIASVIVIVVMVAIVAFTVGRTTAPKPPAPEPTPFGLGAAECFAARVLTRTGTFTPADASTGLAVADVLGLPITIATEAADLSDRLTGCAEMEEMRAARLRLEAGQREANAASDRQRANEVTTLAAAFSA